METIKHSKRLRNNLKIRFTSENTSTVGEIFQCSPRWSREDVAGYFHAGYDVELIIYNHLTNKSAIERGLNVEVPFQLHSVK